MCHLGVFDINDWMTWATEGLTVYGVYWPMEGQRIIIRFLRSSIL